jgi:hypothetical protein
MPVDEDEDPEQKMPTLEEVKEWLKQREAPLRFLGNPTGHGVAQLFRMVEAEKHYRELGLL